jgi:hypothetical protein
MIESDLYISFSQGSYSAASMSSTFEMFDHFVFRDVCESRS